MLLRITLVSFLMLIAQGCQNASFELVGNANTNGSGNPDTFTDGTSPDQGNNQNNLPPTAEIEFVENGQTVNRSVVGQTVTIKPSRDTFDGDDRHITDCPNPGIVEANYEIRKEGKLVDTQNRLRASGCEDLSIPKVFDQPGDYVVTMTVTSNEQEKARSIGTIRIDDISDGEDDEGGFFINATPTLVKVGESISFEGVCTIPGAFNIFWDYKDGDTASGERTTHAYDKTGQYEVSAKCSSLDGTEKTATVTIVVIPGDNDPGNNPGNDTPNDNPDDTPTGPDNSGGLPDGDIPPEDEPGQNPDQQPDPGQTEPPPKKNPRCGCTWW